MFFLKKNWVSQFFFELTLSKVRQNTFSDKIAGKRGKKKPFFFQWFFPENFFESFLPHKTSSENEFQYLNFESCKTARQKTAKPHTLHSSSVTQQWLVRGFRTPRTQWHVCSSQFHIKCTIRCRPSHWNAAKVSTVRGGRVGRGNLGLHGGRARGRVNPPPATEASEPAASVSQPQASLTFLSLCLFLLSSSFGPFYANMLRLLSSRWRQCV
jgi:hypothetical protein